MNFKVSNSQMRSWIVRIVIAGVAILAVRSCFMYGSEEAPREIEVKLCKVTDEYAKAYLLEAGLRFDSTETIPCVMYEAAKYHAIAAVMKEGAMVEINHAHVKDHLSWSPAYDTSDYIILEKTFLPWKD